MDDTPADPGAEPPPDRGEQPADAGTDGLPAHLPADPGGGRSQEEMDAALAALSRDLGGATLDYARVAAVERLNEMRAAGTITEDDYRRERRRLENYG